VAKAERLVFAELENITSTVTAKYTKREFNAKDSVLKSGLKELKKRQLRLKEAYLSGAFDVEEYKREKSEAERQIEKICEEIKVAEACGKQCGTAWDIFLNTLKDTEKNTAMHSVIEKIVYDKENMTLHFYYYF
jgi:hypothetical protein